MVPLSGVRCVPLYRERYLNFGISREELQSGKPIIGIAQTGSDLSPCNRHHLVLAERVREGMSGNLCRCGAYTNIVDAIQDVMAKEAAK